MAAANDLIMVFIGLEISSIASYVLAGYLRDDKRNNESALKYFLLGSFATAFFLYGVALIYGATGTVNLSAVRAAITGPDAPEPAVRRSGGGADVRRAGVQGLGGAVPGVGADVYQGAPAPVTAFLSAGPKAAAFAIFLRIFMTAFEPIGATLGAAGLDLRAGVDDHRQLRRAAADEHQAHAGLQLDRARRLRAGGAHGALGRRHGGGDVLPGGVRVHEHRRVRGGGHICPGKGERYQEHRRSRGPRPASSRSTAALLTIFLLSLIGVPLTGGFFGKFYIFKAALESHLVWLTVLGLLNSAVAAYYYLRILVVMYMHEPGEAVTNAEPLSPGIARGAAPARARHAGAGHLPHLGAGVRGEIRRDGEVGGTYEKAILAVLLLSVTAAAADVTGTWTGTVKLPDQEVPAYFTLKQQGSTITGSVGGSADDQRPIEYRQNRERPSHAGSSDGERQLQGLAQTSARRQHPQR